MKRKEFLKGIGAIGIAVPVLGFTKSVLFEDTMDEPSNQELLACTVTPSETAGPYPAPGTISTSTLVRQDLTEGTQTGIPLSVTIDILNTNNGCEPIGEGYRVDVWHCNIRGYYSAYANQPGIDGTVNTTGQTWLRGIQYTDVNGQVHFTTIYPGWYMPRATHFHVQIYDASNNLILTTQLAFPDSINTTVNTYYNTSGTNSFTNSTDMVFSDSFDQEMMTVTGNVTDGYTAVGTINVAGVLGLNDLDSETGGQFSALISPNPVISDAFISVNLIQASSVEVELLDITGRILLTIEKQQYSNGLNKIQVNTSNLNSGTYFYRLNVSNVNGDFSQSKTFIKQ